MGHFLFLLLELLPEPVLRQVAELLKEAFLAVFVLPQVLGIWGPSLTLNP